MHKVAIIEPLEALNALSVDRMTESVNLVEIGSLRLKHIQSIN